MWLRGWIEARPEWSRKRLARELCAVWEWRDERQRLKDFAARSFLLKLEAQGQVTLPALRLYNRRAPRAVPAPEGWQAPPRWSATFQELGRVTVEPVQPGTAAARQWAFYLAEYHYLGLHVVGENVGYLARDEQGRAIEQTVLPEGREWMRGRLEEKLQLASNALPTVCPASGTPLQETRWRDLQLHTVAGVIQLRVRHGYSAALGEWVCPARRAWGLTAYQRVSPELEARVYYTATSVGSFEGAAAMAQRWGSPVSDDLIHGHVQRRGAVAADLTLPSPAVPAREPAFSLVIMMDGWMARERGADWGASPRKKAPERIAWHEIKSAVIYRLEQLAEKPGGRGLLLEKFIVACPPATAPLPLRRRRGGRGAAARFHVRGGPGLRRLIGPAADGSLWR